MEYFAGKFFAPNILSGFATDREPQPYDSRHFTRSICVFSRVQIMVWPLITGNWPPPY